MFVLILNSILLGLGLAMDAFSVSVANGLAEPRMKGGKMFLIAGTFAAFQTLMPLTGWFVVHIAASYLEFFGKAVPYIALVLLSVIGIKMIIDGRKADESEEQTEKLTLATLLVQGLATSIDALSVGFTTASYSTIEAIISSVIIGLATLIICYFGIIIGRKFGNKFSGKAEIAGGIILIIIGIEIFLTNIL